ncbi:MAG: DUF4349 domain-containing protein [Sphingobacteriales bacterium]
MTRYLFTGTLLCLLAISCQNSETKERLAVSIESLADSVNISSDASQESKPDSTKFIRTADIRFKVNDVQQTTTRIEDIVRKNKGYVAYTHLASTTENTDQQQVSKDSNLVVTYFTVSNTITIRVPNYLLDTTLREIGADVVFLDHRTIKADDVSIPYFENQLGQRRYNGSKPKFVAGAKQKDVNDTKVLSIYQQELQDEYYIANKRLDRDIRYSVVTMELYQSPILHREMVSRPVELKAYHAGLWGRIGDSLQQGWYIFEDFIVFIIRLWGLILVGVLAFWVIRLVTRKTRTNQAALRRG